MPMLDLLLDVLGDAVPDGAAPAWATFTRVPGGPGLELGLCPKLEAMLGWTAPTQCMALGVAAGGWAGPTDEAGAPEQGAPRQRARVLCVMDCEGQVASRAGLADGRLIEEAPSAGRMVDNLRRCFGLPTDPPPCDAGQLVSVLWVDDILERSRFVAHPLDWPSVLAEHPAFRLLRQELGDPLPVDHADGILRAARQAWSWARLRQQAADGHFLNQLIPPGLAEWMDDGMFARWLLQEVPPLPTLMPQVEAVVAPEARALLRRAIEASGARAA